MRKVLATAAIFLIGTAVVVAQPSLSDQDISKADPETQAALTQIRTAIAQAFKDLETQTNQSAVDIEAAQQKLQTLQNPPQYR